MVAYKSSAVAGFIKSPPPACRAVLVYGPDVGLVAERATALAQVFAQRGAGPTEIVLRREFSINDQDPRGQDSEQALLYRDMQTDAVQQLVRRLQAAKTPA